MICSRCRYSWCWDCHAEFSENHGWFCNPFGCNIMKNSTLRHPCIRWLLRCVYALLLIVSIPILIVLFIPSAAAYKGGKAVNMCFLEYENRGQLQEDQSFDGDDSFRREHSVHFENRAYEPARRPCCSPFCILRVVVVTLCAVIFFLLGLAINVLVLPLALIGAILCAPIYCIRACCQTNIEQQASQGQENNTRYNMELDDPLLHN